jgi:membrane protein
MVWSHQGRVFRTLTFWLRPAFVLRALNRFQKIAGFDRSMALASSALAALIPLSIVVSALLTHLGGRSVADRIVERYNLSGAGAEAVHHLFAPTGGTSAGVGLTGLLFLALAVLSFTRAFQRLFEQTWELSPLSVRNTLNGLRWAGALIVYFVASGLVFRFVGRTPLEVGAVAVVAPATAVFLVWGGWTLSAKRIAWRDLVPFGVIGAVVTAAYTVGARVYVPRQFDSYAARYGVIGAVLAMISTLFCIAVAVVASAAIGREVREELVRIRSGERPADDEVRREWDNVVAEARTRWARARLSSSARRAGGRAGRR